MHEPDIRISAPAIYAENPVDRVSNRYSFVPTTELIKDFKALGWDVNRVKQQKSHVDPLHTKHLVVFRNPSMPMISGVIPELLLVNSHDRTTSFKFMAGLFRSICLNGLVVSINLFESVQIRHIDYQFSDIQALVNQMLENMPKLIESIHTMQNTMMTQVDKEEFAVRAVAARFFEYVNRRNKAIDKETIESAISIPELLIPIRKEDESDTVWAVYNRLQEKILKGGFKKIGTKDEIAKRVRPVTNIGLDISVNQKLWEIASHYTKIDSYKSLRD